MIPVSVDGYLAARYVKNRVNIRSTERQKHSLQHSEGVEFLKRKYMEARELGWEERVGWFNQCVTISNRLSTIKLKSVKPR
jgi:hypothetical protein